MMPRWVWFLTMPLAVFVAYWIAIEGSRIALLPFRLEPVGNETASSAIQLYISGFFGPFLAGIGWSNFAPMHRFSAAVWVAALMWLPCSFCTYFDFYGPPRDVLIRQLISMVVGCCLPIVIFALIDRKELKNLRI